MPIIKDWMTLTNVAISIGQELHLVYKPIVKPPVDKSCADTN